MYVYQCMKNCQAAITQSGWAGHSNEPGSKNQIHPKLKTHTETGAIAGLSTKQLYPFIQWPWFVGKIMNTVWKRDETPVEIGQETHTHS